MAAATVVVVVVELAEDAVVMWVGAAALVDEVALPTVTVTSTVPALSAGLSAVHEVAELQLTPVAGSLPKPTVEAVVENPDPVIVTTVPPPGGPVVGLMLATAGPAV